MPLKVMPIMSTLSTFTTLLGLGLAAVILFLLRRDHLYLGHGLFWMTTAAAAAVLGLWPKLIDWMAAWLGVAYPPAALFLVVSVMLTTKALHADLLHTRTERQLRKLNQQLALLQLELNARSEGGKGDRSHAVQNG